MTDKAAVLWSIMQINRLLWLKHCLRRHIESPSLNEFKRRYSSFPATFRALRRKQRSETKIILRLCWTALKTNRCKKMTIYNTALKRSWFIYIMLRKIVLNSRLFPEYFGIFAAAWSYRALQKNSTPISQEKFTGYCRKFKGKWTN